MILALRVAAMALGLLVCLPFHYLWRLFRRPSPWPRIFLAWAARCAGIRVRLTGLPLRSHVLFVANHVSWLDILLIAGATGSAFVSKDDVARWPIVGWLARLNNTIFVARSNRRDARGQVDALRAALVTGQSVTLFPEGTTEGAGEVLAFRASLLAAAADPPLPGLKVQPVAIDYGAATPAVAWVGKEPAATNARRILARRGTVPVVLRFLEPLDPAAIDGRKALTERAREQIITALAASARPADRL